PAQFSRETPPLPFGRFQVVHAGALYYGRSVSALLDAAAKLVRADREFARAFKLTLLGTLDGSARAELERHALQQHVSILGRVGHADAVTAMRTADVLLLVANTTTGAEAAVPGKLFEYLAVGRPIVAIALDES